MDGPAEPIDLRQRRLLGVERDELPPLEIAVGHGRHLLEKRQIAPLDVGSIRLMKHLDQTGPAARAVERGGHDDQIGRILRGRLAVRGGEGRPRRHEQTRGIPHQRLHEPTVGFLRLRHVGEPGRLHPGMADRLHPALFADEPDEPGHRAHRLENAVEEAAEEIGFRHVVAGKRRDFLDERTDLLPRLLDRLFFSRAHSKTPSSSSSSGPVVGPRD